MYIRVLLLIVCLNWCSCVESQQNGNGFFGTVELVKNGRRSRLLSDFVENTQPAAAAAPAAPQANDAVPKAPVDTASASKGRSQTTERMLKNYGNIFQLDPKNLTDKQRVLLERIVERMARFGGSLDGAVESSPAPTTPGAADANSDPSESRARHRNRNVRKNQPKVVAPEPQEQPQQRSEASVPDVQLTIHSDSSSTIATTKAAKRTSAGVMSHPTKAVSSSTTKVGKSKVTQASTYSQLRPNATEVVLGNITTTSIVDSLSKDHAREDLYNRRPIIAEKANVKVSSIFSNHFCCYFFGSV